jgi:hypothetical protein
VRRQQPQARQRDALRILAQRGLGRVELERADLHQPAVQVDARRVELEPLEADEHLALGRVAQREVVELQAYAEALAPVVVRRAPSPRVDLDVQRGREAPLAQAAAVQRLEQRGAQLGEPFAAQAADVERHDERGRRLPGRGLDLDLDVARHGLHVAGEQQAQRRQGLGHGVEEEQRIAVLQAQADDERRATGLLLVHERELGDLEVEPLQRHAGRVVAILGRRGGRLAAGPVGADLAGDRRRRIERAALWQLGGARRQREAHDVQRAARVDARAPARPDSNSSSISKSPRPASRRGAAKLSRSKASRRVSASFSSNPDSSSFALWPPGSAAFQLAAIRASACPARSSLRMPGGR